tara:strand:- start:652 stop:1680 length:1029 start_codon:yes stop_codon:yes gene_type:complete
LTKNINLSVDTLGSETSLSEIMHGLQDSLLRNENYFYFIFGFEKRIKKVLEKYKSLIGNVEIIDCSQEILMTDKPADVVRQKNESSMFKAVQSVVDGTSDSLLSCGNTGALMALSLLHIKTIQEIKRPAIASIWPNLKSESIILDLGANTKNDSRYLIDNAILGSSLASILFKIKNPSIGLLNVGIEENKGNDTVQAASEVLKNMAQDSYINFYGYVEGNDISLGKTNVVVTDGFTGNIALKTAEGTAKMIQNYLSNGFKSSIISKIGYLLSFFALKSMSERLDPRIHNCGILIGLNSPVIKCHGKSEHIGISYAADIIHSLISNNVNEKIKEHISLSTKNR